MTWHAVAAVDDAVEATRRFLFPFSVVRWTKVAILVLFMGASANTTVSVPPVPNADLRAFPEGIPTFPAGADAAPLLAIGGVLVALVVLAAIASLSLRLVFYDALRTNVVRLREPFRRRLRQAAGLFGFSLGVGILLGGPFALVAVAAERGVLGLGDVSTGVVAVFVALAAGYVAVAVLVLRFTYEFVVPVMVLRDEGVLAAWRRFWRPLRESWTQFLAYLLVHFFLALGVSIAESVVFLLVGGTVVVLAGVVLLVAAGLLGGVAGLTGTTAGLVTVGVVVAAAVVVLFVVLLPVRVLTRTYLVTYEVSTLAGVDPDLALLAPGVAPAAHDPADEHGDDPADARSRDTDGDGRDGDS